MNSYDRCVVIHLGEEFAQVNIFLSRIVRLKGGLFGREVLGIKACGHV